MSLTADIERLRHITYLCQTHYITLSDTLQDLFQHAINIEKIDSPDKELRRLLDQFAYRYLRMQDDMGTKLIPAILYSLQEPLETMSMIDRLNRCEQLGWIPSADEWGDLRRIRNEFAHDYPEDAEIRFHRLKLAINAAKRLMVIWQGIEQKIGVQNI